MNKYQRILAPFMGGFIGIILAGYAYYATHQHHSWLLPIGVLIGSAIGFFIGNIKKAWAKAVEKYKTTKLYTIAIFRLLEAGCKAQCNALKAKASKTPNVIAKISDSMQRMVKAIYAWGSHPVTKSSFLRSLLSLCTYAVLNYLLFTFIWGFDIIHFIAQHNNDGHLSSSFWVIYPIVTLLSNACMVFMGVITKWWIYDSMSSYYKEWELFGNKRELVKENMKIDIKLFIYTQVLALALTSVLLGGIAYIAVVGGACMVIGLIGELVLGYLKAMKEKTVMASFITTLVVTTLSYFWFRNAFSNQMMIWVCAFVTGTGAALCSVALSTRIIHQTPKGDFELLEYLMDKVLAFLPVKIYKVCEPLVTKATDRFMAV